MTKTAPAPALLIPPMPHHLDNPTLREGLDMPGKAECEICEEERDTDTVDEQGVCNECHDENAEDTAEELSAAGIDPDESPVVMAAEIMRRVVG